MVSSKILRAEPPYMQIARAITERIARGELAPGDRLPTGAHIMEEWGVSKATANRVAGQLRSSGLAYTEPGVGLIVRATSGQAGVTPDAMWRRILAGGPIRLPNERSERTVGRAPAADAPDVVAACLDATAMSELAYRRRVIYRDERPYTVATSWFLPALLDQREPITDRLVRDESIPEGTPRYIADRLGRELSGHRHVVGIVRATTDDAAALGVQEGDPLLRIVDTINAEGWPIECGVYLYPEAEIIVTSEDDTAL
ncbi:MULTISPECIES: GntR family transcriptional regulator [unclassified Pseudonocardia]|uniref:GntR family transcriptional regulator n=1 Tax=unclassified Pseudonocardia TaxID=2619320 RepID=UPI000AD22528|nr:GntR family transcriptional regulator [Pseudonocardia sp. Ae406_Ps2]